MFLFRFWILVFNQSIILFILYCDYENVFESVGFSETAIRKYCNVLLKYNVGIKERSL